MDAEPLRIRFDKLNGLTKIYNGIKYLELSDSYNEVLEYILQFFIGLIIL